MPIYLYQCEKCKSRVEMRQELIGALPLCCGKAMSKLPTTPSLITIMGANKTRTYSNGYKDNYAKEYRRSIGKES